MSTSYVDIREREGVDRFDRFPGVQGRIRGGQQLGGMTEGRRRMSTRRRLLVAGVALVAMIVPLAASAAPPAAEPGEPELLAALPGGAGSGSAVGPGGSLFVPSPRPARSGA